MNNACSFPENYKRGGYMVGVACYCLLLLNNTVDD